MTIEISVLKDQGILDVKYLSNDVTQEDLNNQREMVAAALTKNELKSILIDALALTRLPTVISIFDHNAAVSSSKELKRVKFAVIFRSLGPDERFLETTGINRGLYIKCFTSREEGLSWLQK